MTIPMEPALKEHLEVARIIAMERAPYWMTEIAAMVWVQASQQVIDHFQAQGVRFTMAVTRDWVAIANPCVVTDWKPAETATVMLHELMHLWQQHDRRMRLLGISSEDFLTWNCATDLEINDDLDAAKWPFPKTHPGIRPSEYGFPDGLLAEEYFERLLAMPREKRPSGSGGIVGMTGGLKGSKQTGPGQGQCGSASGAESEAEGMMDLPKPDRDDAEVEETVAAMAMAIEDYASKHPGRVPAGLVLDAKRMRKKSAMNWKAQIRTAVRTAVSAWKKGEEQANWSRFNRRQMGDIPRPTFRDPLPLVAFVRDSSGSMVELLERMYPEIEAVLSAARAKILMLDVDCQAYDLREVKSIVQAEKYGFQGGGGTDFRPAFDRLMALPKAKRPGVVIYATDGFGEAPAQCPPGMKVVWLMIGGTEAPAKWGSVVHCEPPSKAAA